MNPSEHAQDMVLEERHNADTKPQSASNTTQVQAPASPRLSSKRTLLRTISAGLSFFCAGVNDGSLGPLIPYILRTYKINTNLVSVVYGTTFCGWLLAALSNSHICQYLDLGAMLSLGAGLQLLAQVLRVWLPPFPLYAVTFFVQSLGMAFQDTHSNTFVSSLEGAHRWLGFIHALYALGCGTGPFIASAVASAADPSKWNLFYAFPIGIGVVNLVLVMIAFREQLAFKSRMTEDGQRTLHTQVSASRNTSALKEMQATLRMPAVWLLALFFFFFLGSGITAGGWVVEYLVTVRQGSLSSMGYVPAGFWGGMFLGRLLLAEPTKRLGERRMVFVYALCCLGLQLLFWLVPNIIAGAVFISLFGFFYGPFFATGVSIGSKIFPDAVKSSALAFVFVLGQIGGSVFPAITGVIAAEAGVKVLQPILVGLIAATAISWLLVPRVEVHRD